MKKNINNLENIEMVINNGKNVAQQVILNILDREEKLNDIQKKSNELKDESQIFYKKSKVVKKSFFKSKCKVYLIIFLIVLCILYFILSLNCGFDFKECKDMI